MPLPAYVESHKGDAFRLTFTLVKVSWAVPQCLTDCEIPIVYGGDTYHPTAGLVVSGVQDSQEDRRSVGASIRIGNASDLWGTILASLSGPDRHPPVQILQAWLDPAAPSVTPAAVRGLLVGAIESSSWDPIEATLTVGPATDMQSATLPWREVSTRCTYRRFKGAQCGYGGAMTTCDRSFATCSALGNQGRFGGFRSIPSTQEPAPLMTFVPIGGGTWSVVSLEFQREEG